MSALGEQLAREARVDGRDAVPGELVERLDRRLLGHGRLERAAAEAEPQQLRRPRAPRSRDEVGAGDAAVDDAVLHVLGDVGGAHEQHVDRRVPARERERALAGLLGAEARVLEQRDRRLAQPALRRDGDRQAVGASARCDGRAPAGSRPRRGAASAPRASPSSSTRPSACAISWYGSPCVQQLRHLPAVRHRLELRQRAEVPEEALRLVPVLEARIASKRSSISGVRHGCDRSAIAICAAC